MLANFQRFIKMEIALQKLINIFNEFIKIAEKIN